MLLRLAIATLAVFLVFGWFKIAHTEIPSAPPPPQCLVKGRPQTWNILSVLSNYKDDTRNITYKAHYCHPSLNTLYCSKNKFYKTVCTFNKTNRIRDTLFQCNMTKVVWYLYPNLLNLSIPAKVNGNTLCNVVSATYENRTSYSKSNCCSVRKNTICKGILNLQGRALAKRELNITWETPADIDDGWNEVLDYKIRYTGNSETKIVTYRSFRDQLRRPSRHHSLIIKGLPPYTLYAIAALCYYVSPSGNFMSHAHARTLPEAPNSPPTITGVQTVSSNKTMKSVKLKWRHPPKNKRNGVILKSVVSYRIKRNVSSSSGTLSNNTAVVNLTIDGQTSEAVIMGLDVHRDYGVTVTSCTVECSEQSSEYKIKGESNGPLPSPQASTGSSLTDVIVAIGSVVGISLVVVVLLICYAVYRRKKKRRNQVPRDRLPDIDEIQVSHTSPDSDFSDYAESSDYARPATLNTPVESTNEVERASMLQNENEANESEHGITTVEEIPLC